MDQDRDLPIVVIGAGPVGLAAAAHLAAKRQRFLVFVRLWLRRVPEQLVLLRHDGSRLLGHSEGEPVFSELL